MREVEEVEVDLLAALFRLGDEQGSAFDVLIAAMGDDEEESI
jgi:hypothetical protein